MFSILAGVDFAVSLRAEVTGSKALRKYRLEYRVDLLEIRDSLLNGRS